MNDAAKHDYESLLDCMKNQGGSYDVALIEKLLGDVLEI